MTFVIKVAKPGKSVFSTNPRDLSVDSQFQAIMRLQDSYSGTVSSPVSATTQQVITHNLGYRPFYQVFVQWNIGSGYSDVANITNSGLDASLLNKAYCTVTDTALNLYFENASPTVAATVKYYAFIGRDPVN